MRDRCFVALVPVAFVVAAVRVNTQAGRAA